MANKFLGQLKYLVGKITFPGLFVIIVFAKFAT